MSSSTGGVWNTGLTNSVSVAARELNVSEGDISQAEGVNTNATSLGEGNGMSGTRKLSSSVDGDKGAERIGNIGDADLEESNSGTVGDGKLVNVSVFPGDVVGIVVEGLDIRVPLVEEIVGSPKRESGNVSVNSLDGKTRLSIGIVGVDLKGVSSKSVVPGGWVIVSVGGVGVLPLGNESVVLAVESKNNSKVVAVIRVNEFRSNGGGEVDASENCVTEEGRGPVVGELLSGLSNKDTISRNGPGWLNLVQEGESNGPWPGNNVSSGHTSSGRDVRG